ncbi:MAG: CBS domain-containing protein [Pyrodictiaceae archaeon]
MSEKLFPVLGHYPPAVVLEENESMLDALIAFNIRGVRFGVVVDSSRKLKGLMSVKRIIKLVSCHGDWKELCEKNGSIYNTLVSTRVSEVMRRDTPYVVLGRHDLEKVIEIMARERLGAIPVVLEDKTVVGIITERHIAAITQVAPMHIAVHEIMTVNPITISYKSTIREAIETMSEKWIRHLPVVDEDGRPVAMVTSRDIIDYLSHEQTLRALRRGMESEVLDRPVTEIASHAIVSVPPHEDLNTALRLMRGRGLSSIIVVDATNRLVGIMTERDVVVKLPRMLGVEAFYDRIRQTIVYARPYF